MPDVAPFASPEHPLTARYPDARAWALALGVAPGALPEAVATLANEQLETLRWRAVGVEWPVSGQRVEVLLMEQGTGQRIVTDAGFHDGTVDVMDMLWPWSDTPEEEPTPNASLADLNLRTQQDRARGPTFSMSGGDWSASFAGPWFARRGLDYSEKPTSPLLVITHWRQGPRAPEHLAVPEHLAALVAGEPDPA